MPKNDMQWSSATPGLLIILIDQSGSMLAPCPGDPDHNKTQFASLAVNNIIDNIIQKNFNGEEPKNRCFISVIGYNHNVSEITSGWLKELVNNPKRIETMTKKVLDGTGGLVEQEVKKPIWVEPITEDGATNMRGAFSLAKDLCKSWIDQNPDRPAPVIINISDGMPYYDRKPVETCMEETRALAEEIKQIHNMDGNILIFNALIGDESTTIEFPSDRDSIQSPEAKFIYDISSEVPASEMYIKAAKKNGFTFQSGSHGCVFNADAIGLIRLINFGSTGGSGDNK